MHQTKYSDDYDAAFREASRIIGLGKAVSEDEPLECPSFRNEEAWNAGWRAAVMEYSGVKIR